MTASAAGLSFDEAIGVIAAVGDRHRLGTETLPLSRCHGRVLAVDAAPPGQRETPGREWPALSRGGRLGPLEVGRAAAMGLSSLTVSRRPTVAVFTIGDSLAEPGLPLGPGQSHDGSRELLTGLLRAEGLEPTAWPRLADDRRQIEVALRDAGCAFDLIVTCGAAAGPGRGGSGHVASVVAEFGEIHFQQVRMSPGGAVVFGSLDQARLLGFPADFDAVAATWSTLGRALVDGLEGRVATRMRWRARLTESLEAGAADEVRLLRGWITAADDGLAIAQCPDFARARHGFPHGPVADALIVVPEGPGSLPVGTAVDAVPL